MRNHCVFYRTNLKFDGRICALIRTLSGAFPNDQIYLYEYPLNNDIFSDFPKNVKIIKSNLLLNKNRISHALQQIKYVIYAINSLFFLLIKKPKTIQVHDEYSILGPLIYKLLFKKTILVYDDKEMYHPRDKNIPKLLYKLEYMLIKASDIVIITNEFRKKALYSTHGSNIKKHLIVDNFVFEPNGKDISKNILDKIKAIKKTEKKILLHQGVINKARGSELLIKIANELPDNWVFSFIGISPQLFEKFTTPLNPKTKSKLCNLGYIDYDELNSFYKHVDAVVIFYLPTTFNNNFCAPNRLYSAVNIGIPLIVNSNNYTLRMFIKNKKNGITINASSHLNQFFENYEVYKENTKILMGKYEYDSTISQLADFYSEL